VIDDLESADSAWKLVHYCEVRLRRDHRHISAAWLFLTRLRSSSELVTRLLRLPRPFFRRLRPSEWLGSAITGHGFILDVA